MADTLTINGSSVNMITANCSVDQLTLYSKGGIPQLKFSRLIGLPYLSDPWSGKSCSLTLGVYSNTNPVFKGYIQGYLDRYMGDFGWVREYRALGLRNNADHVPVTDSNTLTDTAMFNLPGTDPNFIGARAGQSVGQIATQVLQMVQNGANLTAQGIGNYTIGSGPTYTLPTVTATDLSTLTVVPQQRIPIAGERILQTLEAFIQTYHPNHYLWVDPSGNIRFLDLRVAEASPVTVTLNGTGTDIRWGMPELTRDYSDCYSQVEVRGSTLANICTLQTLPWPGSANSDGGLIEDFPWGTYTTNALAIAAWVPPDWTQPSINGGNANDTGSCVCTSTTTVNITSSTSQIWVANFWGQGSGQAQGVIYLYADVVGGAGQPALVQQMYQARIVANTASTGGTSTLTLDRALPALTYNAYSIWGTAEGANVVWRKYKATNAAIAAAMLNLFPYPVAIASAPGNAASTTSSPQGYVWWSSNGSPPYNISAEPITLDPVNGLIYFNRPTALVYGGGQTTPPSNVSVIIPIANGLLSTFAPSSSTYSGTLYTVEGVQRTKTITVQGWTDYGQSSTMATYASEFLDSVKNCVIEGTITYEGLNTDFILAGQAINITGYGYTTGWEAAALPVVSCEIMFNSGAAGATSYSMSLGVSNRRGRYTADQFLRPAITTQQLGFPEAVSFGGFGAGISAALTSAQSAGAAAAGGVATEQASSSVGLATGQAGAAGSLASGQMGAAGSGLSALASEGDRG